MEIFNIITIFNKQTYKNKTNEARRCPDIRPSMELNSFVQQAAVKTLTGILTWKVTSSHLVNAERPLIEFDPVPTKFKVVSFTIRITQHHTQRNVILQIQIELYELNSFRGCSILLKQSSFT